MAALTDPLGNIRGEQDYDEFGNPREVPDYEHKRLGYDWDDEDSRFTYTGELWDDGEEILYLRARHYMPQIGRFLTRDSYDGDLTNPLTRHKYAYVANNPINNLDPSGNIIETASDAVSLGISIGEFAWEPNFWTGLAVIYDTAALLTPVVPAGGGYFIAAVKHGKNMEKYLQVAKEILARGNKILDKIKAHTPWWAESVPRKIKGYINDLRKRFDKFTGNKANNNNRGPSNKNSDNKNTNKDQNSKGMVNSVLKVASNAAFKAAKNINQFKVSNKHLMSAGGRYRKFNTDSIADVNKIIKEALTSKNAQFLPNNQPNSYKIITNLGKKIGTKGESKVQVIVGADRAEAPKLFFE